MSFIITLLGNLFAKIVDGFGKLFSIELVKWIAYKAVIAFVMFAALPIVLYNTIGSLLFDFLQYALSYITGLNLPAFVVEISGIGAYIASKIKLLECITLYFTFVSIKFMFRFIPFL